MTRNTTLFFGILGFCCAIVLLLPYNSLFAASDQVAQTSVTIIDPSGPGVRLTAIPEKRIPNVIGHPVNRATLLNVKVFPVGVDRTNPANLLFETTTTTNDVGVSRTIHLEGLSEGNYDIVVKGYSHLSKLKSNVYLSPAFNDIDMTATGTAPLKAGDVNLTAGDDEVNALDIAILVDRWNVNNSRSDLNQDTTVNSLDASILLDNFGVLGD
jgi:hypothetical protein